MECWVHHYAILDDDKANQSLKEAWEHEDNKDELKIELQGLERQFWLGTQEGSLACYDFPGETWAGDGSAHKGGMGAGIVCLQRQDKCLVLRVGREEEGVNSPRLLLLKFSSRLEHCFPDGFRPRGHSLHAFVRPFIRHFGCADGPLSTFWQQLSCSLGLDIGSFD